MLLARLALVSARDRTQASPHPCLSQMARRGRPIIEIDQVRRYTLNRRIDSAGVQADMLWTGFDQSIRRASRAQSTTPKIVLNGIARRTECHPSQL